MSFSYEFCGRVLPCTLEWYLCVIVDDFMAALCYFRILQIHLVMGIKC
jgi:hypothetical protein